MFYAISWLSRFYEYCVINPQQAALDSQKRLSQIYISHLQLFFIVKKARNFIRKAFWAYTVQNDEKEAFWLFEARHSLEERCASLIQGLPILVQSFITHTAFSSISQAPLPHPQRHQWNHRGRPANDRFGIKVWRGEELWREINKRKLLMSSLGDFACFRFLRNSKQ